MNTETDKDLYLLIYTGSCSSHAKKIIQKNKIMAVFEVDEKISDNIFPQIHIKRTFEDYLDEEQMININEYVRKTFGENFISDKYKFSYWNNIYLGKSMYRITRPKIIQVIRNLICADLCLKEIRPSRIYVGDGIGLEKNIWLDLAKYHDISCTIIKNNISINVRNDWVPLSYRTKNSYWKKQLKKNVKHSISLFYDKFYQQCDIMTFKLRDELYQDIKNNINVKIKRLQPVANDYIDKKNNLKSFNDQFNELNKQAETLPELTFNSYNIWKYIKPIMKDLFKQLPKLVQKYDQYKKNIELAKPKYLLTKVSIDPDISLVSEICDKMNIILVLWNSQFSNQLFSNTFPPPKFDKVLCWTPHQYKYFSGYSSYDSLVKVNHNFDFNTTHARNEYYDYRSLGIDKGKKNILFVDGSFQSVNALTSPLDDIQIALEEFIDSARKLPDLNFIVKFHPNLGSPKTEGFDAIQKRVNLIERSNLNNLHIAPLNSKPQVYINECFLAVHQYSTMGIEFMLKGKCAILINLTGKKGIWKIEGNIDQLIAVEKEGNLFLLIDELTKNKKNLIEHLDLQEKLIDKLLFTKNKTYEQAFSAIYI